MPENHDSGEEQELPTLPEGAEENADGTVTYALAYPIGDVSEVTIRRKRMDDNLAIKKMTNPFDIAFELIIRLTGLVSKQVQLMDDVDSAAIGDVIEFFSKPGRQTGSSARG